MKRQPANCGRSAARPGGPRPARRHGSAILELSLALPILLSLTLLCVDFGRVAFYYIAVTNAARAGAGYAGANPYPVTAAAQAAWKANARSAVSGEFATNSWYDSTQLTVAVSTPTAQQLSAGGYWPVTVTATYSFQTLINWRVFSGYNRPISLSRTVVMQGSI